MRGYLEQIDVTLDTSGHPTAFVWRGRRYRVGQVLDVWRERTPWWRLALLPPEQACADGEESLAGPRYETEHHVWRVEAAAGTSTAFGIFDIAQRPQGWTLQRLSD